MQAPVIPGVPAGETSSLGWIIRAVLVMVRACLSVKERGGRVKSGADEVAGSEVPAKLVAYGDRVRG